MGSNNAHKLSGDRFRLGAFIIVPDQNTLIGPNKAVEIEPRLMRLLLVLIENQGKVLSREKLLSLIWSDVVVQEDSLTKAISQLRKHLNRENQEIIKTIRKVGYLLDAKVDKEPHVVLTDPATHSKTNKVLIVTCFLLAFALVNLYPLLPASHKAISPLEIVNVSRLTSSAGTEIDAALSWDGKYLAYVQADKQHVFDIRLLDRETNTTRTIVASAHRDRFPSWDHHNNRIAFIRNNVTEDNIMVYDLITEQLHELLTLPIIGQGLTWGNDNDKLYFSAKNIDHDNLKLYELVISNGTVKQITTPPASYEGDQDAVFNQKRQQLGFIRHNRQGIMSIMAFPDNSGDLSQPAESLFTQQSASFSFGWFKEGVLYDKFQDGQYAIYYQNLATNEQIQVDLPGQWNIFAQSTDDYLLYLDFHVRRDIMLFDVQTQSARPFISSTQLDFDGYFNHANEAVAYISSSSGQMQLHLANVDGTSNQQLTRYQNAFINSPKWSPDDQKIAFQVNQNGDNRIDILDIDTLEISSITFNQSINSFQVKPAWSKKGEYLYFGSDLSGDWQIHRYHFASKKVVQITLNGGRIAKVTDNDNLILFTRQNQTGLWSFDIHSKKEQLLVNDLLTSDLNNWFVDGSSVYFVVRTNHLPQLDVLDLQTLTRRTIGKIDAPENVSMSYAKHLDGILYTKEISRSSDVMLATFINATPSD